QQQYPRGQHTRSNLIVIQPVPLDRDEPSAPPSNSGAFRAIEPPKLSLPQDRWCPQVKQGAPTAQKDDTSKRKVSGKFSHFESSSESEESDNDDSLLRSGSTSSPSAISLDEDSCDIELNVDSNILGDEEDTVDKFDTNSNSECASQSPISTRDPASLLSLESNAISHEDISPCLETPSSPAPKCGSRSETSPKVHSPDWASTHRPNSDVCMVKSDHRDSRRELGEREGGRTEVSVLVDGLRTTPEACPQENALRLEGNDECDRVESPSRSRVRGVDNGVSKTAECGARHSEVQRKVSVVEDRVSPTERRATPISWEKRAEGDKLQAPTEGDGSHSASNRLEARRRKFESNAPVCATGGKIVLLKGQKCVDQTSHPERPRREARSRSRSGSASPPLLRSVLSVVKVTSREPSPLSQVAVAERKRRHRAGGGRTVEIMMPDVGHESSEGSERAASSIKLPVHLRLGEAPSAVCTSRKKKSKRKRSSRDSSSGAKRKRTKASLDHSPRQREQRWRRKVCSLGPTSP
ncbi:unnamed protein product, partial [Ixodes hexagonus]